MSAPDFRPGADGELDFAPEKSKNSPQSDTPIDWYGQTPGKRKNSLLGPNGNFGSRALTLAIALFVMAFILVGGAVVVLLRLPQQIVVVTSTQAVVAPVALVPTAAPSLSLPTVTPVPQATTLALCQFATAVASPLAAEANNSVQLVGNDPGRGNMLAEIHYLNFDDISRLNMLGGAGCAYNGNTTVLRFLTNRLDQTGAVWDKPRVLVGAGFTATFQFQFQAMHPNGYIGDGFAFVIQGYGEMAYMNSRCGIGYDAIPRSLAVEFDTRLGNTYQNTDGCGAAEPNNDHVAVQSLWLKPNSASHDTTVGANLGLSSNLQMKLADGNIHSAIIIYKPGAMTVFVDKQHILDVSNLDLASGLGINQDGLAYVGFTAGDNRGESYVDILNWTLTSNNAPNVVSPPAVALIQPEITFYPAFTPVGMNLTPVAVAYNSGAAAFAGAGPVSTLTPHWNGFTPTPLAPLTANNSPPPADCASFNADTSRPKIAYETNRDGGWNIYVTDPSGTLFCRLTQPGSLTANHAYQPAWSPDRTQIVFVSDRANGFQLYTMNADGSNQRQLANNIGNSYRPAWSPDGNRVAFVEQIDKTVFELHVIDLDGSNSHLLINDSRASYPAWSPNGSRLVYDALHNGRDLFYVADAYGSDATKLIDNGLSTSPSHIAWSPDSGRLAFDSSRTGRPQVFVANANGTGQLQLTNSNGWNYNACWLSDGRQIAFDSTRDGHAVIYRY